MRNLLLIGALLFLPLGACASIEIPAVPAATATTADERAYAEALNAYVGVARLYLALDDQGLLPASVKAQAKPALQTAKRALDAARVALAAANAADFNTQMAEAARAIALASSALPQGD